VTRRLSDAFLRRVEQVKEAARTTVR
jgi:hypothetical protein